jgi:methylthioribose-1-phosphate isomerase
VHLGAGGTSLELLDQRALPAEERWLHLTDPEAVAQAIESLAVRGAPAIGCAAALAVAVASRNGPEDPVALRALSHAAIDRLARTRPTAVNLFVALEEMRAALAASAADDVPSLRARLLEAAQAHVARDAEMCRRLSEHGAALLPERGAVLTHCNTGALATAGIGTALGVIRRAWELGKRLSVYAGETRPLLQGARLTAWELARRRIPVTVITDGAVAAFVARGRIDAAIVGADRIARNGDVANKIGTYSIALACHHHGIPFYVAAPWTTIDEALASGADIPIEARDPSEIAQIGGRRFVPEGVAIENPAFDVTPAALVTAIVTDRGVHRPDQLATQRP